MIVCLAGIATTATIPYIRGTSETIALILQPYNILVAHKPITTLRRLLTNVKDKTRLEDTETGSSIRDQMLRLPGHLHWWDRQKPQHATDWTQTSDKKCSCQKSRCWTPFTDKSSHWLRLCWMHYVLYKLLATTMTSESWFTNLEQTPLNRSHSVTGTLQKNSWRTQAKPTIWLKINDRYYNN